MSKLRTIEYSQDNAPTHTVICMHGLGASADNLSPLAPALKLHKVRFVFPQAPEIPVTINHGQSMPAWYDVKSMDFASAVRSDHAGVDKSCDAIKSLIANEQAQYGIKPSHIFLMGFSQGGSLALELGLHYSSTLAGIIGLSTLPAKGIKTFTHLSAESKNTPIFLAHGTEDSVVPFAVGELIHQTLKNENYAIDWNIAATGHEIWPEEMVSLAQWFKNRLR